MAIIREDKTAYLYKAENIGDLGNKYNGNIYSKQVKEIETSIKRNSTTEQILKKLTKLRKIICSDTYNYLLKYIESKKTRTEPFGDIRNQILENKKHLRNLNQDKTIDAFEKLDSLIYDFKEKLTIEKYNLKKSYWDLALGIILGALFPFFIDWIHNFTIVKNVLGTLTWNSWGIASASIGSMVLVIPYFKTHKKYSEISAYIGASLLFIGFIILFFASLK